MMNSLLWTLSFLLCIPLIGLCLPSQDLQPEAADFYWPDNVRVEESIYPVHLSE